MTSQPPDSDDTGADHAPGSTTAVPRWVKAFVLAAIAVAVLGVVVMLLVGGEHGPGRHQSAPTASHQHVQTTAGWDLR